MSTPERQRKDVLDGTTLITGGAGFIGANLAHHVARSGGDVVLLDNLSRREVHLNAEWLKNTHGDRVRLVVGDVRDLHAVRRAVARADRVFHLAAQVAVTSSIIDPRTDFSVNAQGTLNVLTAIAEQGRSIPLVYTSTNKVYGALSSLPLEVRATRWTPVSESRGALGIDEGQPLDFHSPYGCSKGAADQYVLDWARSFGMPNVVFRMSCIYGPRQFGNEDQGWVAHFLIRAMRDEEIVIYGDGKQVRDVLCVHDLIDMFHSALGAFDDVRGKAFNVGGGPRNTMSLVELVDLIRDMTGTRVRLRYAPMRSGDQRWYVSNTQKLEDHLGWRPQVELRAGLERLIEWLDQSRPRGASSRTSSEKLGYHP